MLIEILTKEDLENFRKVLIKDLVEALDKKPLTTQKLLKSFEVRKLLNISPGTLQALRDKKILNYSKIGNIHYYSHQDIEEVLKKNSAFKE